MSDLELGGLVAVIIVLCEAIKRAGFSTRYIPVIAVILGIVGAIYLAGFGGISWLIVAKGVFSALVSSGIYSGFKRTVLDK